jgi:predicted ribosome quality control (RQC) complex YloA/Tae2 family protein
MKKFERHESAETLRKHSKPLTFFIYYQQEMVHKAQCQANDTVADLFSHVRHKLSKRFENIMGLATVNEHFTLDYTLQIPHYPLANYRNCEKFYLLLEEVVSDYSSPTLLDFTFLKCIG